MTITNWVSAKILVTVKSYPRPSKTLGETVCVAGITAEGEWIRLYPVMFRDLPLEQQFGKYDWIECRIAKSPGDYRAESYIVDPDSIRKVGHLGTDNAWARRRELLVPKLDPSLESLKAGSRSLGFIKPRSISKFELEADAAEWSQEQRHALGQLTLFSRRTTILRKVPWVFRYVFRCDHDDCEGHALSIVDWEVFQSYRKWERQYPQEFTAKLRQKYFDELVGNRDLHFFVGTPLRQDKYRIFMVIGLYYPPVPSEAVQLRFEM